VTLWERVKGSDPRALAVVDGLGPFTGLGPHYSRRNPGGRTFTGVGQEIVLLSSCGKAVWAVVRQRTPTPRGKTVATHPTPFVWRNMLFRNLGAGLSSDLIRSATTETYRHWLLRYGTLPTERLRTEVDTKRVQSRNPGYCYLCAGWERGPTKRGKLFLYAPQSIPEDTE